MGTKIKLSTSFFSYAIEWNSGRYTLGDLLAENKKVVLGPGIELVGFQSFRGYPNLSSSDIVEIKGLMDRHAYEPACLGSNTDIAIRRDRMLTMDETFDYLLPQLKVASELGFPVMRVQMTTPLPVVLQLVPIAEKLTVQLGVELHTPYMIDHPGVLELREAMEKVDSPYLGVIPDFGTSMRTICEPLLQSFKEVGVREEWINITKEIWNKNGSIPQKFKELHEQMQVLGANPIQIGRLNMAFSMNGRQPVDKWKEMIPRTVHLHGKFYGFNEQGEEPSIDYAAILKVFYQGGYEGFISSEYEGSAFTDQYSTFGMIQQHHALCAGILEELEIGTEIKLDENN